VITPRRATRGWWVIRAFLWTEAAVILFEMSLIGGMIIFRSLNQ